MYREWVVLQMKLKDENQQQIYRKSRTRAFSIVRFSVCVCVCLYDDKMRACVHAYVCDLFGVCVCLLDEIHSMRNLLWFFFACCSLPPSVLGSLFCLFWRFFSVPVACFSFVYVYCCCFFFICFRLPCRVCVCVASRLAALMAMSALSTVEKHVIRISIPNIFRYYAYHGAFSSLLSLSCRHCRPYNSFIFRVNALCDMAQRAFPRKRIINKWLSCARTWKTYSKNIKLIHIHTHTRQYS